MDTIIIMIVVSANSWTKQGDGMGDTELKNCVPFINFLRENSGAHYNYIG